MLVSSCLKDLNTVSEAAVQIKRSNSLFSPPSSDGHFLTFHKANSELIWGNSSSVSNERPGGAQRKGQKLHVLTAGASLTKHRHTVKQFDLFWNFKLSPGWI